jgi:hypothetical protein
MLAMPDVVAMLGVEDGEMDGSGWPGGGIVSPARDAYGPTCGAIDDGVGCWEMAAGGIAAAAATDVDCGGGVLP